MNYTIYVSNMKCSLCQISKPGNDAEIFIKTYLEESQGIVSRTVCLSVRSFSDQSVFSIIDWIKHSNKRERKKCFVFLRWNQMKMATDGDAGLLARSEASKLPENCSASRWVLCDVRRPCDKMMSRQRLKCW